MFKDVGFKITIEANLKIVNFLDVTLNLNTGKYYPFRKPNDLPLYINSKSNHPPNIIKNLPDAINQRLSDISHDEDVFNQAAPLYQDALRSSGYDYELKYAERPNRKKRNRQRNIIWFNPPFSKSVSTNIAARFLRLLDKHFPTRNKLHKIFNRNTVKVIYIACQTWIQSFGPTIKKSKVNLQKKIQNLQL